MVIMEKIANLNVEIILLHKKKNVIKERVIFLMNVNNVS